ncbi:MAG: DnaJ domain-containing protein [Spirochaetia bacterium]|nr:DnaJ domain-containing protein [Spirochaetia bacterium]
MSALDEILEEIESMREGDRWEITLESVLAILGVTYEDYCKAQYHKRKKTGMNLQGFSEENAGRLVEMLAGFGYDSAGAFQRAGYFFSADFLQEWQEFFISVTSSRLLGHEVDRSELENALSACRKPGDGLEFYCETKFNLEELVQFASSLFLRKHGIESHSVSAGVLNSYILQMYNQRILKREDLFSTLNAILIEKAIEWRILRAADVRNKIVLPPDLARALETLEMLTDEMPQNDELKRQYRTLLKRYHPDVNPTGLEKTREINTAYTFVITRMHAMAES